MSCKKSCVFKCSVCSMKFINSLKFEPIIKINRDKEYFINSENKKFYDSIITLKDKIGQTPYSKYWEKMKKRTNPYELIHTTHSNKNMSIADYIPLSRSYFKMWEILNRFGLLKQYKHSIITAHLAEGPGGFIEATRYYRRNYYDYMHGITLKSTDGDVPGWNSSRRFLNKNRNIEISYGNDGTGNLYNINNILHFADVVGKAEFITADGGFDFSVDYDNQERLFYRLFLCEVVTALSVQKVGGSFVCKIFDIFHRFTVEILYILYNLYDEMVIDKPVTSRPANSEKYVILSGFKGINIVYLRQLQDIVLHWDDSITGILSEQVTSLFLKKITIFNNIFNDYQVQNIQKTLDIIDKKISGEELETIRKEQCKNAIQWCNNYGQRINRNCFVLKKFYNWRLLRKKTS